MLVQRSESEVDGKRDWVGACGQETFSIIFKTNVNKSVLIFFSDGCNG